MRHRWREERKRHYPTDKRVSEKEEAKKALQEAGALEPEEKRLALRQIMRHYTGRENWDFPDAALEKTAVWALRAHWFTAKERG